MLSLNTSWMLSWKAFLPNTPAHVHDDAKASRMQCFQNLPTIVPQDVVRTLLYDIERIGRSIWLREKEREGERVYCVDAGDIVLFTARMRDNADCHSQFR